MDESQVCPECGAGLPADAPGGLCPRCLMGAVIDDSQTIWAYGSAGTPEDRGTASGPSSAGADAIRPAAPANLDRFKRAVLELGLIRHEEFDRFVAGALGGVPGLAKALVLAGKLTPYQAAALSQGKARGLVIGNYFILDKLGAGGMGVVFKARHRRLGRVVALKILLPSLARDTGLLLRFRREVNVAARLSHPNIVSVLDADEDRGVQFMTMEYIEGNDLDRLVRDGGVLPVDLALDCVIQSARGLEAAHAQGIVHRDIKPGNLMLDGSGLVRVLDLGLARLIEAANPFGETALGPMTQSGTYMGTVDFMAPEQGIDSSRVDHRADIYSLGCTLCYLLTGRAPFEGTNVLSRLMAHQGEAPSSLMARRPDVPKAINAAYQKMMSKKPADRPASMSEVIELLEACRSSADEARSGLKMFATTVILKRASPEGSVPDSSDFSLDEPEGLQVGPGPKFEDSVLDREEDRPAAPVASTVGSGSVPIPARPGPARPRKSARRRSPALVLGVLAVLAMGGLGYSLIPPGPGKPLVKAGTTLVPDRPREKQGPESSPPEPPPPAPRSSTTFEVVTLYSIFGEDHREGSVESIAVTATGHRALIGSWTEHSVMINVDAGTRVEPTLGSYHGWQGARPTVAMTPDGRRALIGTLTVRKDNGNLERINAREAGILWFWNLKTGKELFPKQQPYNGPVTSVAISPDGLRGLSASREGELTLWDLSTGKPQALGRQKGAVAPHAMAFFPDGRRAATAGRDKLVHIWDLDTGREQAAWTGHDEKISGLAISPDGGRIVTGSFDAKVILWDVARADPILHRFAMPPDDTGTNVAFDPDGNIVAAGNGVEGPPEKPGHLIVWDARTYDELRRDERPFARHLAVAALSGGRVLTGDRFALRLWTPRQPGAVASEPPASENGDKAPVDLLSLIQSRADKKRGWEIRGGELVSPTTGGSHLPIPYHPPPEYRIDLEVERIVIDAEYSFALGFVVDGRQTEIIIDKKVENIGKCTGLNGFDGTPVALGPKVHRGQLLIPSRPARFALTVRRRSINLTCDGSTVLDWRGDPKRLIRMFQWHIPDPKSLFLATSSSVKFRKVTLTPLTSANP